MTILEEALTTYITANIAAIGNRYAPLLPQNPVYPAIVFQVIDDIPDYTMEGVGGLARMRVQHTIFGTTYLSTASVAESLRTLLAGYHGTLSGIRIGSIFVENDLRDYEATTKIYTRIQDCVALYSRA